MQTAKINPYVVCFALANKRVIRAIEYLDVDTSEVTPDKLRKRAIDLVTAYAAMPDFRHKLAMLQSSGNISKEMADAILAGGLFDSMKDYLIKTFTDRVNSIGNGVFNRHLCYSRYVLDVFTTSFTVHGVPRLKLTITLRPYCSYIGLNSKAHLEVKTICTTVIKYVLPQSGLIEALPYNFVKKELA